MIRIAHLINPVNVTESANFYKYQQITFKSIIEASKWANNNIKLNLYTTQFTEDQTITPVEFHQLSDLKESTLEIFPTIQEKKLPYIFEIFDKFSEVNEADYYLYTNADIALMPFFYNVVSDYIANGHDAIVINRRRISKKSANNLTISQLYSEIGKSHPGFDCFIFKAELLRNFILGKIIVGIPFIEVTLLNNIAAFSRNPLYLTNAHLTFHIGMEVLPKRNKLLYWHNRNEFFKKIQPILKPLLNIHKFPYAYLPFYLRAIKWILNPSLFTINYLELENRSIVQKIINKVNEFRWRILNR